MHQSEDCVYADTLAFLSECHQIQLTGASICTSTQSTVLTLQRFTTSLVWLQVFSKCGVIKEDDERRPRVKVYRDRESGMPKGDGLVTYLKDPSVSLKLPHNSYLMHAPVWCCDAVTAA